MADPVVELQSGLIRGIIEKHEEGFDYYAFKGIPYAEPPVGDLRFKDPVPRKKWSEIMDCQNYGPMCLQYDIFSNSVSSNEDCLHLNVFTKTINTPNENIPVMVVIHGGGFMFGSSDDLCHGPEYLIRKDLILVTINYRLGVLGFLNLEDEVAPGNQGLKDQIMALQWVQQNIRVFGGDPGNVTILGLAAGGICAHYLALSPLARGLMHKVISQTSTIYNVWHKVYNPKSNAIKLCSMLGKELTDSKEIFDFLKKVDTVALQDAQERFRRLLDGHVHFSLGIDDKSPNPAMPIPPEVAANQGTHLPYLVGYNSHEASILLLGLSREDFFNMCDANFEGLFRYNTKEMLSRYNITETQVRRLYYENEVISAKNVSKFISFASEIYAVEGIHRFARVQAEKSLAPTYLFIYSYDHPESISSKLLNDIPHGASHLDDQPFLFKMRMLERLGIDYVKKGTKAYEMMDRMTELWANFAKYGKPTIGKSDLIPVHWEPINDGTVLRYLNLDEDITMQSTTNVDQKLISAKNIKV